MKNIPLPFKLIAVVTLVMLTWCRPAFCGEIHDASQTGDLAKVKALVSTNRDLVSNKDTNGWLPLHYATMYGHKEVVELLFYGPDEARLEC
jgi:ankyrin repeat protein